MRSRWGQATAPTCRAAASTDRPADRGQLDPVSRVLEVKSTIATPLRFYVTRNEWEVCQKMGNAYYFHIWDMNTKTLYERTAAAVQPHIPVDQGTGRWSVAEIRVGPGPSVTVT